MIIPHVDEARGLIIEALSKAPFLRDQDQNYNNRRVSGADISVHEIVSKYYFAQGYEIHRQGKREDMYIPFYDATWELARIGILRPGDVAPAGSGNGIFRGDYYSLTEYGIQWVKATMERTPIPLDPSRFIAVIQPFEAKFGTAFLQRASEAISCHRNGNYLACCVMAGAAAESILLATAVVKAGDEAKVLSEYRVASGRKNVLNKLLGNVSQGVSETFRSAMGILSYWRDEAGHGQASTIQELEAFAAITQLLRLAQFTADNFDTLTKTKVAI